MSFKIESSNAEETILLPGKAITILLWVVKLIGLCFLIPGLLLLSAGELSTAEDVSIVFILTGIGLAFYIAGVLGASYQNKLPAKLVFNNASGKLLIFDKVAKRSKSKNADLSGQAAANNSNTTAESTFLSYSDIDSFGVREFRTNNSTSYAAYLKKTDGAVWDLFQSNFKKKAEQVFQTIKSNVNIDLARSEDFWGSENQALEDVIERQTGFRIIKEGQSRLIQWMRKSNLLSTLLILLFIAGFNLVFIGARSQMTQTATFIAFTVLAIFDSIILVALLLNSVTRFVLKITPDAVIYSKLRFNRTSKTKTISLADLHSVSFHFSLTAGKTALFLADQQQADLLNRTYSNNIALSDVLAAIKAQTGSIKIHGASLSFSQKLQLEKAIQALIRQVSGKSGF